MKKILFPTDFSPAATQAYIYALQLAKAIDASIVTLHAYQLPSIRG
ncbi:MAG: universal stress protein, partial [Bacteroidota bacterium]